MSLINDYLKKSRAAKEDPASSSAGVPPVMKQPQGGASVTAQNKKKVSPRTVVLLVLVILVGIAGYFMTMPPPTSSPQPYPESTVPGEESQMSGLPEAEKVPGGSPLQPATSLKTELHKKNRVAGGLDKQKFNQAESQPALAPSLIPEKGMVGSGKKVSPVISSKYKSDVSPQITAVAPQTAAAGIDEFDNVGSDPASVRITSVPLYNGNSSYKFNETAGARVRRPNRKDDLDHLFQVGVLALNSGNRSRALYYFNQVLDLDPKHQDTLLNLAVISLEHNDFEKSRELLAKAAINDPHDARVKVNQGLLALKSENFTSAQKLFTDALLIDPGSTSALNNLAWLAQHQGDKDQALFYYRNLVALDPQNLKALLAYASYCEREKDFSQAIQCYHEALQNRFLENDQSLERRIRERIKLLGDYVD